METIEKRSERMSQPINHDGYFSPGSVVSVNLFAHRTKMVGLIVTDELVEMSKDEKG